jgi:hypothetical protein
MTKTFLLLTVLMSYSAFTMAASDCDHYDQKIDNIKKRMRQGYSASYGEFLKQSLRTLQGQRSVCEKNAKKKKRGITHKSAPISHQQQSTAQKRPRNKATKQATRQATKQPTPNWSSTINISTNKIPKTAASLKDPTGIMTQQWQKRYISPSYCRNKDASKHFVKCVEHRRASLESFIHQRVIK